MATGDIAAIRIVGSASSGGDTSSPIDNAGSCDGIAAEIDITQGAGLPGVGGAYSLGIGATNGSTTSAKIALTVTGTGYDAAGAATTPVRTVYGTVALRKTYPNGASNDENVASGVCTVRVTLSEPILSGETVTATILAGFYAQGGQGNNSYSGAVTNNSTLAHPKGVGRWETAPYQIFNADGFHTEFTVIHGSAQNKWPLACVKITATDGSNSVTKTITDMTISTTFTATDWDAGTAYSVGVDVHSGGRRYRCITASTGNTPISSPTYWAEYGEVLVYDAVWSLSDVSTLTAGVIYFNAVAYPWLGDSSALLNTAVGADGIAQPSESLGPLYAVKGAYGQPCAIVDSVNGHASAAATWVAADKATAESTYNGQTPGGINTMSAYTTAAYAVRALKAYNAANNGHDDPGGGIVALREATNVYPGTGYSGSTLGTQTTWVTITNFTGTSPIITSGTINNMNAQKVRISGVHITSSSAYTFYSGATSTDIIWIDNNVIAYTGSTRLAGVWKVAYFTNNTFTAISGGLVTSSTNHCPYALIRGNVKSGTAAACDSYNMVGNFHFYPNQNVWITGNANSHAISSNVVIAFNRMDTTSTTKLIYFLVGASESSTSTDINNFAIIQNVLENTTATNPLIEIGAAGEQLNPSNNVLIWHNSIAGSRCNFAYNGYGAVSKVHKNWSLFGNQFYSLCHHPDDGATFDTSNGARSGGFSILFGVGFESNNITGSDVPVTFPGIWSVPYGSGTRGFVSDKSSTGTAAGGGDYHQTGSGTGAAIVQAGRARLPFDFDGTARRNLGSGAAGAYEYGADASGAISGTSYGTSDVEGTIAGAGFLAGSSAGLGDQTATLRGSGALIGTSAGSSDVSATALQFTFEYLSGESNGSSTVSGILGGDGALIGTSDGTSTVTGSLDMPVGALVGSVDCSSTVTGTLMGIGTLSTAGISGTSVAEATLLGWGSLHGLSSGTSSAVLSTYSGSLCPWIASTIRSVRITSSLRF